MPEFQKHVKWMKIDKHINIYKFLIHNFSSLSLNVFGWTVITESCSAIIVLFCDFEFGENFLQIPQFQALNWWSDAVFETYCGEETHAFNNLIQILNWIALFSVPGAKTTLTGEKNVEEEKCKGAAGIIWYI